MEVVVFFFVFFGGGVWKMYIELFWDGEVPQKKSLVWCGSVVVVFCCVCFFGVKNEEYVSNRGRCWKHPSNKWWWTKAISSFTGFPSTKRGFGEVSLGQTLVSKLFVETFF